MGFVLGEIVTDGMTFCRKVASGGTAVGAIRSPVIVYPGVFGLEFMKLLYEDLFVTFVHVLIYLSARVGRWK